MTTLKSALRFPPAHPPPLPPPPEPQYPNLTSRFSAETLLIKSPPRPFQRLFSSTNHATTPSPPLSPPSGAVRRYHRRVSSQKGGSVYRHAPSASESRLVVSSPKAYDLPETPTRASMDHVRPTRRSGSISRAKATNGTAADKLAGAAKDVLDMFTLRRHGHGHGRQGSHSSSASGDSVESLASTRPRSLSSPSPALVSQPPPAPRRRPPPRPYNPPAALVDPPPRSDSRNAMASDVAAFGAPSRAAHGPPAPPAGRPRPKQLPLQARPHLRPTSPPSPSIPPLRPARQPPAPPAVDKSHKPFHAMIVSGPTRAAVERRSLDELLVRIDVGGQSTYTTSAATLVGQGVEGGRLGDFVEAVLEDVRRGGDEPVEEDEAAAGHQEHEQHPHPYLQLPGALTDASSSSLSLAPSLTPSPYPSSPFPFADNLSTYSTCAPGDGDEPMSPIDPLVNSSQAALASKELFLGLPHAFSPPPHPLPTTRGRAQYAEMVGSPTLPHGGKHRSVYPDVGSSVDLGPEGGPLLPLVMPSARAPPPSLAEEAARKALTMRSRAGVTAKVEPAADDEIPFQNPFERGLGPYFDVVRNQLHASVGSDSLLGVPRSPAGTFSSSPSSSPILATSPRPASAVERSSLDFGLLPSDVEGYGSEEEHRSRSTVLGVPRGLSRRTLEGLSSLARGGCGDDKVPAVPRLAVEADTAVAAPAARSRAGTPSLSMSVSTVDDEEHSGAPAEVTLEDATLAVFLDRTDSPLMSLASADGAGSDVAPGLTLYGAVVDFLRNSALPASLVLPPASSSTSSSHVPTSSTADPDVDPLYLSLFALAPAPLFALLAALRTLSTEAAWLGLQDLERACSVEQERVAGVGRWLAQARGAGAKVGARDTTKGLSARAKEGWI
ncbi:uncharacterized protein RHOBADRAFT_46856 [Rhodotorula graminis WP1]|uniref:Uncharacterized protein n=1 Tax=Rhodotorula graminis (strain WP1) TaxID=578459 RepID=A0A0N8PZI3_RHOGW|nr:uncharacterized protein RHOBADRAFT_46856 [Rhodotorula graminis WP1]KPV72405.1 hypothetical protein RHOBADRAFT_46856 [Rhodotorula graminis WP1]